MNTAEPSPERARFYQQVSQRRWQLADEAAQEGNLPAMIRHRAVAMKADQRCEALRANEREAVAL
ncbi:hypothetical protein [Ruficoccus sp. ZRK36]|uniref:hypothetical protein n=1 Tax=Ruficoccus sp. ZRK36 TaxID=2866311 RepID=UPI001C72E3F9|nr:hypothetical protein [Ruficoccus sp. ZRK36]QYY35295.1 hypothetical protein K0V07_13465 [Ruficoccus sp. ZRK36]